MNRPHFRALALLALIVVGGCLFVMVGCKRMPEEDKAPSGAVQRGGTLKVGLLVRPDTLDPHRTYTLGAIQVHNNIYNGILKTVYANEKLTFEPDLAESWEQESATVHLLRLRKAIKFHDGSPFDAQALAWSLSRVKSPDTGSPHAWKLTLLEKVEIVDDYTVQLHFSKPYPFFRVAMTGSTGRAGTMVPKSAVDKWSDEFGVHPVGTGPFLFVEWIKNNRITLERNPQYFEVGKDGKPLPYLDKVEFRLVDDVTSAITALETGELDGLSAVPFHYVGRLRRNPSLVLHETVGGNWTHVTFNTTQPPFDDVNLRRAVAYGIDREALIKQVYAGCAIPAHGPISPPMTDFYSETFELGKTGQAYAPNLARRYLAQSQYSKGVEVSLLARGEEEFAQVATVVKSQLERLGIKVKIDVLDVPAFNKRFEKGEFDMVTWHWVADLDPDETLYPELRTGEKWNSGSWSNAEFDALVDEAQITADPTLRAHLYQKAQAIIADQCPVAVLVHKKEYKVFNKRVRGFVQIPADLIDLHRVWIER